MSKELDEFYKKYSARIIAMDDTPLVKVMDGGKFKLLSIEEYEQMITKMSDLEAKLAESEKKFIVANNLRKNSDEVLLNYKTKKYGLDKTIQELRKMKLSLPEKEWYYKGFENCERQMSSHIADLTLEVKELKQQLSEKDQEVEKLNKRIENQVNNSYKIIQNCKELQIKQLEKVKELCREKFNWWENSVWEGNIYDKTDVSNAYFDIEAHIEEQINQLKGETK